MKTEMIQSPPFIVKLLGAALAGVALPFAFATTGWWWLAFIAPMVLLALLHTATPKQGFWLGLTFGAGFFGIGVSWVYYSIYLFGDAIAPVAAGVALLFVMAVALYLGLFGWLSQRYFATSNRTIWALAVFPALWVLIEWFRGWFLTGFPWLALGYSQVESPLAGFAPIGGVYLLSWLSVLLSGLLYLLLVEKGRQRITAIVGLVAIFTVGYGLQSIQWSEPSGNPRSVRIVQGNFEQQVKFDQAVLRKTLDRYITLSSDTEKKIDLLVWPETAIPTFWFRVEDYLQHYLDGLQEDGTELLSGVFRWEGEGETYYNAFLNLTDTSQYYYKQHLVPFGEFMPFRFVLDVLNRFIMIPMSDLTAGAQSNTLQMNGYHVGAFICYEAAFGEELIPLLPTADILVNVSNDGWFGDSLAPHQHLQISQMRALEFARPLIRATNTGVSAYIDYRGRVQATTPQFEEAVLDYVVQPRQGTTLYTQFGNYLVLLIIFFSLVFSMSHKGFRKKI